MIYIIAGIAIAVCIVAIIFALKVLRENKELIARKKEIDKDERFHF